MTVTQIKKMQAKLTHPDDLGKPKFELETNIPHDLDTFYKNVGYFINQKDKTFVTKLASHQIQTWDDRKISNYRLYLKSQKIGLSTMLLLEDFHIAITRGRGQEMFIVAQSKDKAKVHLQDLKKIILNSIYKDYLIDIKKTEEDLLRDERTKTDTIYLRNPDMPRYPTVIYALGITSPGSLISSKRVSHIHMSDVTLADMVESRFEESFGGVFSRLINTEGTMVIECPPRGPDGPVYRLAESALRTKDGIIQEMENDNKHIKLTKEGFLIRRYTYQVGINCGMITQKTIDKEKARLGPLFAMYYEARFFSGAFTWYDKELIKYDNMGWDINTLQIDENAQ